MNWNDIMDTAILETFCRQISDFTVELDKESELFLC